MPLPINLTFLVLFLIGAVVTLALAFGKPAAGKKRVPNATLFMFVATFLTIPGISLSFDSVWSYILLACVAALVFLAWKARS